MLTIARTLMGNPRAVLLDEPSEGLAPVIVEQMAATILELKRDGLTILLSEQNLRFAQAVADRARDHRDRRDPLPRHDGRAGRGRGGARRPISRCDRVRRRQQYVAAAEPFLGAAGRPT